MQGTENNSQVGHHNVTRRKKGTTTVTKLVEPLLEPSQLSSWSLGKDLSHDTPKVSNTRLEATLDFWRLKTLA